MRANGRELKKKRAYSFHDFFDFGLKHFRAAIFGILILAALALTKVIHFPGIARYDLLLIIVILIQVVLLLAGYERPYDLIPIMVFHVLGMVLEIYKVNAGSWAYPDEGLFKIAQVPLYSAFMYSAIGSYIVRAIKEFDILVLNWPKRWLTISLSALIYLNFFTDIHVIDYRNLLYLAIILIFWRSRFTFVVRYRRHEWPVVLAYFLIGLFIYFAENIGSFLGGWKYTYQIARWHFVDLGKLSSWVLLIIVSIIIVIELQHYFSKKLNIIDITEEKVK